MNEVLVVLHLVAARGYDMHLPEYDGAEATSSERNPASGGVIPSHHLCLHTYHIVASTEKQKMETRLIISERSFVGVVTPHRD